MSSARISGDEFVFLCEDLPDAAEANIIRTRIERAVERPFVIDGLRLSMKASIGLAVAGPGEEVSNDLIVRLTRRCISLSAIEEVDGTLPERWTAF